MRRWWLRLMRYARPQFGGLAVVLLLMLVGVALEALKPWPLKLLVDHVLQGQELPDAAAWITALPSGDSASELVGWLAAGTVMLYLASQAIQITQNYVQSGLGNHMMNDLGAELLDHLQRLSLRFHHRKPTGDLVRRVTTDTGCVRDLVLGVFLPILTSLASLVTMFAVMWRLDRSLSRLAILVAPLIGVLVRLFDRPMMERTYQHQQLEGEMMALAEQTLTALPLVQAFGRAPHQDERFRGLSRRTLKAYLRAIVSQLQFRVGVGAATAIGTAAVMAIGGLHVLQGSLSVGSLLVFLSYLGSLYTPMQTLAYLAAGFASAAGRARRVLEVLEVEDRVRDAQGARPLPSSRRRTRGHVRLIGVTFGYEPGRPVLKDVTLEAHPGEVIALVGPIGAGKSTLVSLIPRFFDPWEGRVTFDGHDVRGIQLASLRAQVAVVLQEPFLLPLTVAQNIAYGRPEASDREIAAAAAAARADGFIRRLPRGYDTVVGERGSTFSIGEQQRIGIARALLRDAAVLILDEPTSALDAEIEAQLLEALERLIFGRTTFLIAHRLSTIRYADRIVVLEDGKVVETGTQQELLAAGRYYYRLHRMQFGDVGVA